MSKVKTAVTLLLIVLAVAGDCQAANHGLVVDRARRVLQEGVKVTITPDPAVKAYCDDKGIASSDISITNDQRKELQAKADGRYSSIIDSINDAMKNGFDAGSGVKAGFGTGVGFGIVCGSLAFLSLIFLFFWAITECCCKKTCCAETQKKTEGRGWFRWCCYISSAVLGLTAIALTIAYAVYLGKIASRAPELKCGVAILKSDVINGVKINSTSVFVGTTQADVLLGYYIDLFDSINSIKANAQNVKNKGLTTKATTLTNNANSYKTSFSASSFTTKGAFTPSTTVTVGFALMIKTYNDADGLKTEATTLATAANNIDSAMSTIVNYDSSSISSTKSQLKTAKDSMKTQLSDRVSSLFDSFAGSSSSDEQIKKASQGFLVASIVVIIVFTIVYLVILGLNIKDKCHPLKCLSKIIMLIQLLLAVLILFLGAILTVVSIFITYACVAIDGTISTQNYLTTKMTGLTVPDTLQKLMNGCVYEKGDGNLFTALGMDLANFNNINSITSGLQSYQQIRPNLTSQSAPYIGGMISGNITGGINYDLELAGSPSSEDTVTGMSTFNSYKCSQDTMVLKETGTTPKSSTGDTDTQGLGAAFSIQRKTGEHKTAYVNRYAGAACSGLPSGKTTTDATNLLNQMLDASDTATTAYTSLQTNFNSGFFTAESDLFTTLKGSTTDLDTINSKMDNAIKYLNNANSTLPLLLDCRVLQKEITLMANILCYRVGDDIYQVSGVGLALGFIIFVYSWVMCCSIRLSNPKDDKEEGSGAVAYREGEQPAYGNTYYQDGQNKEQYNGYQ